MLSTERKILLLNRLKRDGTIHVKEIANELKISETTIRRDLVELEEEKKLTRVYGGAVRIGLDAILTEDKEVAMNDRMHINFDTKTMLCQKASELVKDGECIFLDGGTTIVPMIDYLAKRKIKIVTHNHLIMEKLVNPTAEIIFIGGLYNAKYQMSEGPSAQNTLKMFNFDRAFIGCAGVDLKNETAYTAEMQTREIKMIAMANSNHSYLLIDESKLNVKGFCLLSSTSIFDSVFVHMEENAELPENFINVE